MDRFSEALRENPDADEKVVARAFGSFDTWSASQPVSAFSAGRKNRREYKRMRDAAIDYALEREKEARGVAIGLMSWIAWNIAAAFLRILFARLFDKWWNHSSPKPVA